MHEEANLAVSNGFPFPDRQLSLRFVKLFQFPRLGSSPWTSTFHPSSPSFQGPTPNPHDRERLHLLVIYASRDSMTTTQGTWKPKEMVSSKSLTYCLAPRLFSNYASYLPGALVFLRLFLNMICVLVAIQKWCREFMKYAYPSVAPQKRGGRVRTCLNRGPSPISFTPMSAKLPVTVSSHGWLFVSLSASLP